jgi:acylphosphatase
VKGKVQGVFYRATAKEMADRYGITGWVRNTEEGNVELMASGKEEDLQRFVDWCRKGPKRALVENVFVATEAESSFTEFTVLR